MPRQVVYKCLRNQGTITKMSIKDMVVDPDWARDRQAAGSNMCANGNISF